MPSGVCEWCGGPFRPRAHTQRFCSKQCAGLWQYRHHRRRVHKWGKRPPVDAAHRRLRAELLPAAIGTLCPLGCGRVMDCTSQLDHIVARARGGQTTRGNCRIICKPCNMERGARLGGTAAHAKARQARRAQPALGLGSRGPHW